jgi:two-component system chemotaxis family response regulator WspR
MATNEQEAAGRMHRVLLVEDQPTLAQWVRDTLEEHADIAVTVCSQALQAVACARQLVPSLIIQDLLMPHLDGLALLALYRQTPELREVPVIVLSAISDVHEKSRAFSLGAADYMVKVPHAIELVARVRAHSHAYLLRRERDHLSGELQVTMAQLADSNVKLARVAREDGLTGLANRRAFDEALEQEWRRGIRDQKPLSLALIDIDFFKLYNDRYGHVRGDECLKAVAAAVAYKARRAADLAARYGGEEMALLLPATPAEGARAVAERVRAAVSALQMLHEGREDGEPLLTVSIGVATLLPSAEEQQRVVVEAADAALYQAKRRGRNRVLHAALDR